MRSRRRVACILLLLAVVFAVCWLPYHIASLVVNLNGNEYENLNKYLLLLGHANSALNPIIYCVLSKKFRSSTVKLLKCDLMCLRKQQNPNIVVSFEFNQENGLIVVSVG